MDTLYITGEPRFCRWSSLGPYTHQRMQEKTTQLCTYAQQVGLNISQKKTEVMLLNVSNPTTEQVNGEDLPTIVEFTYLGSKVRHDGGAGSDIKNRLNKTRNTFGMHNNVWRSSQYSTKMKLKNYQNLVLSILLCGSEYRRMLENDKCFGLTPSPTNSYSPAAVKTTWGPSLWKGDGDGLDMSWEEIRTTTHAQPFTGHQRGKRKKGSPKTPGAKLLRRSSRPWSTLGVQFTS